MAANMTSICVEIGIKGTRARTAGPCHVMS
jgi:hypothetical protein